MVTTSPPFRRRRLGRRIRHLRETAGMTQEAAATALEMSTSALSRKETGEVLTSVHEARSMMDLYDVYDEELLGFVRAAREKGWWRAYGVEDRGYVDLETEACTVRELSLMYIPGLLQTEDYMRAVFGADRRRGGGCDNDVAVRLIRQKRLTDEREPLSLVALVDEGALHRPIGGRDVMRAQLHHVIEAVQQPQVRLQVLPVSSGPHIGMDGAFVLLSFPEPDDDVMFVAHAAGAFHIEKKTDVEAAKLVFERLLSDACSADESVEIIAQAARKL